VSLFTPSSRAFTAQVAAYTHGKLLKLYSSSISLQKSILYILMISSSFASMEVRLSDPCFLELVAVSSIVILATFHSFHIEDSGVLEPVAL